MWLTKATVNVVFLGLAAIPAAFQSRRLVLRGSYTIHISPNFCLQQKEKSKVKQEQWMNKIAENPEDSRTLEAQSWSRGPWKWGYKGVC